MQLATFEQHLLQQSSSSESFSPLPQRRKQLLVLISVIFFLGVVDVFSDATLILLTLTRDTNTHVSNRLDYISEVEYHRVDVNSISTLALCNCSGFCSFSPPIEHFQYVCPSKDMFVQLRVVDTRSAVVYLCKKDGDCLPNRYPSSFVAVVTCAAIGELWGACAVLLRRIARDDYILGAAKTSLVGLLWLLKVVISDQRFRRTLVRTPLESMPHVFALLFFLTGVARNFASSYYATTQLSDVGGLSTKFYVISVAFSFLTSYSAFLMVIIKQLFQVLQRANNDLFFYPVLFIEMLLFMIGCGYLGFRASWTIAPFDDYSGLTHGSLIAVIILVVIPIFSVAICVCLWLRASISNPNKAYLIILFAVLSGAVFEIFLVEILRQSHQ